MNLLGQVSSNFRTKTLKLEGDSVKIDTLSIDSGSFKVLNTFRGIEANPDSFRLNWQDGYLVWLSTPAPDSIQIQYVTYPTLLTEDLKLFDPDIISSTETKANGVAVGKAIKPTPTNGGISRSGSITRGVSVGNNQNVYVNSSLDLQLSGEISDGVEIKAALNDRNLPIQPEGTSSQIQEFDNVYVEISSQKSKLVLGDFLISSNEQDYFFKTYKKAQGASGMLGYKLGSFEAQTQTSYAVARGKFARNTYNGEEGNQGPYRLTGNSGELFIIVVAGSERVFINGELLERGEDFDYIIDYNAGELTFTPNRLITQFDRIIVEFQYADNSFERSIFHTATNASNEKAQWGIQYYSEQDSRTKAFYTDLTPEDRSILAQAGDDLGTAVKNSEERVEASETGIFYEKNDTLVNGVLYNGVYSFQPQEDSNLYRVTFSYVGPNKGNYVQESQDLNGRVYKWVAPENGTPSGEYEPIIQLIAPRLNSLLTGNLRYKLNKRHLIGADIGISTNNLNRYSSLDSDDDLGYSFRLTSENRNILNNRDSSGWQLGFIGQYEYKQNQFVGIERYRGVEFERKWNRQLSNKNVEPGPLNENLFTSQLTLSKNKKHAISLSMDAFTREDVFQGFSYGLQGSSTLEKFTLSTNNQVVSGSQQDSGQAVSNTFFLSSNSVERRFGNFITYGQANLEENLFGVNLDSLGQQSNGFREYAVGFRRPDSLPNTYMAEFRQKWVLGLDGSEYLSLSKSNDISSGFELNKHPRNRLKVGLKYRQLEYLTDGDSSNLNENTLIGRIEYGLTAIKGAARTTSYYQMGTGRERQFEVVYSKVGAGQGNYVWNDINNNGKEELGEFRVQDFSGQGEYVRLIVNNNSYLPAISNEFNQNLHIQPAALWGAKKGFLGFISKFNNLSVASIRRKTKDDNSLAQFNPLVLNTDDAFLISTLSQLRNTLSFNKLNSNFSADFISSQSSSKNLFTFGFESVERIEQIANVRLNFNKSLSLLPTYKNLFQKSRSEAFAVKNFNLNANSLTTKLSWQKGSSVRVSALHDYYLAKDLLPGADEVALKNTFGLEANYASSATAYFNAKVNLVNIDFTGDLNSPVAFVMLQSLRPGVNYTWQLNVNFNVSKNTNLSVIYDGRKSEEQRAIHTGSVNLRWLF